MRSEKSSMDRGILGAPLRVVNRLMREGHILDYAIAGGVAALYYTEPVLTYDFDVVCRFPGKGRLIDPSPLYSRLRTMGYTFGAEDRVAIEGVPVQFIPASPGLMEEALSQARAVTIGGVKTKILRVEHLAAIRCSICTGRKIVLNWI